MIRRVIWITSISLCGLLTLISGFLWFRACTRSEIAYIPPSWPTCRLMLGEGQILFSYYAGASSTAGLAYVPLGILRDIKSGHHGTSSLPSWVADAWIWPEDADVPPKSLVIVSYPYPAGKSGPVWSTDFQASFTRDRRNNGRIIDIRLPLWAPTVTFAGVSALLITPPLLRRRWRRQRNLCLECGYDLRASPDRCPECGTPRPDAAQHVLAANK